jgi:hypothetical protein
LASLLKINLEYGQCELFNVWWNRRIMDWWWFHRDLIIISILICQSSPFYCMKNARILAVLWWWLHYFSFSLCPFWLWSGLKSNPDYLVSFSSNSMSIFYWWFIIH